MKQRFVSSHKSGNRTGGVQVNASIYIFILLILISFLLLMFVNGNYLVGIKNSGLSVFLGARNGIHEITSLVSRTILSMKELSIMRKEYSELLKTLERYQELERSNAEIIQENIRLRDQLNFAQTMRYRNVPAQISGRDPLNLFSAIVINKGSFSGVKNDMAVVAWQNGTQVLVGKVIQTGTFESLVMPIYDKNSLIACRFTVSRFEGIVEGQGNSNTPLLMRYVPKRSRDDIRTGDIIISSGMGDKIPAGINIGRVSVVNIPEYETTLVIEITTMIDFSRLEYVFVIEEVTRNSND